MKLKLLKIVFMFIIPFFSAWLISILIPTFFRLMIIQLQL